MPGSTGQEIRVDVPLRDAAVQALIALRVGHVLPDLGGAAARLLAGESVAIAADPGPARSALLGALAMERLALAPSVRRAVICVPEPHRVEGVAETVARLGRLLGVAVGRGGVEARLVVDGPLALTATEGEGSLLIVDAHTADPGLVVGDGAWAQVCAVVSGGPLRERGVVEDEEEDEPARVWLPPDATDPADAVARALVGLLTRGLLGGEAVIGAPAARGVALAHALEGLGVDVAVVIDPSEGRERVARGEGALVAVVLDGTVASCPLGWVDAADGPRIVCGRGAMTEPIPAPSPDWTGWLRRWRQHGPTDLWTRAAVELAQGDPADRAFLGLALRRLVTERRLHEPAAEDDDGSGSADLRRRRRRRRKRKPEGE